MVPNVGETRTMVQKDASMFSKKDNKNLETNSKALKFLRMSILNSHGWFLWSNFNAIDVTDTS